MAASLETVTVAMSARQRVLLRGAIVNAYREALRTRTANVEALVDARDLFDIALLFGVPAAELTP